MRRAVYSREEAGPPVYLADITGADLDQLQAGFLRWVSSGRWRLVSLTDELAHLAGADGSALRIRRAGGVLVMTATRGPVEAVLELDQATRRPLALTLRRSQPGGVVLMRLVSERVETVNPALVPASAFGIATRPPGIAKALEPPVPVLPSVASLDAAEIQVLYALHQARACLGDPLELVRNATGIEIRGQAATSRRKQQLIESLSSIPFLAAHIQSAEEAASGTRRPAQAAPVEIRVEKSAIADRLEQYLLREFPGDASARAAELSDRAVAGAQSALTEAWALRRLAEWTAPEKEARLNEESRRLLGRMVRDHLAALRGELANEHALLAPVLLATGGVAAAASSTAPLPSGWQDAALRLFDDVQAIEHLAVALFARAGAGPRETGEQVQQLLEALSRVEGEVQALDGRLAIAFAR